MIDSNYNEIILFYKVTSDHAIGQCAIVSNKYYYVFQDTITLFFTSYVYVKARSKCLSVYNEFVFKTCSTVFLFNSLLLLFEYSALCNNILCQYHSNIYITIKMIRILEIN